MILAAAAGVDGVFGVCVVSNAAETASTNEMDHYHSV
jgi:hypothetical protein